MSLPGRVLMGCSMLMVAASVYAYPKLGLTNYQQLSQVLNTGGNVTAILRFDRCVLKSNPSVKGPLASTRLNFDVFSNYQVQVNSQLKNTIATSNTMLLEHSKYGIVYAYDRLRIFEDGVAEFHVAYYDPNNFSLKNSNDYICHLSNGRDENGVMLFNRM